MEELARSFLREPVHITVGQRNGAATTVHQELLFVGDESGKLLAMRQLLLGGLRPPILVFVQSRARAGELLEELRSRGWSECGRLGDQSASARHLCLSGSGPLRALGVVD
eukprot:COSAG01_NODE_667_length_14389_cov_5.828202_11_plen_110_part_00